MTATGSTDAASAAQPVGGRACVVVGFDNTPAGTAALRWAAARADRDRRAMQVVHVHERPDDPARVLEPDVHDAVRRTRQRVFALVCQRLADVTTGDGGLVSVSVVEGRLVPELARAARDADLLVIGQATSPEHAHLADELSSRSVCALAVVSESGTAHLLPARSSAAVAP